MTILSTLDPVRFYTALDPYYYTVDNRPIKDLRNNIEQTASAADAAVQAEKNVSAALGYVARGYALRAGLETEVMVGEVITSTFDWTMDHSFLIQQIAVSGTDLRVIPKLGITVDSVTFDFQPSATVGEHNMYVLDAQITPADATSPFYDAANTAYPDVEPFEIGNITYTMTPEGSFSTTTAPTTALPAGWVRIAIIRVPEGAIELTPEMTTYVDFKEDGAAFGGGGGFSGDYELNIDARQRGGSGPLDANITVDTLAGTTLIDSLTIDPSYAMVYVDGVYQTGYQVIQPDSILLPEALPVGTRFAFVSTAGGTYTGGAHHEQRIQAAAGDQYFTNLEVRPDYMSLYIDGAYQSKSTYEITSTTSIALNVPLSQAATLYLVERSAGLTDGEVNVPSGGAAGEVLTKDSGADYDMSWQPATGVGGAALPPADPIADKGKVLTFSHFDTLLGEPVYDWRTVSSVGGAGGYLHQDLVISAPGTNIVTATRDPSEALIFVGGAFQGKNGRDFDVVGNDINFYDTLPTGTIVDIVFPGGSGGELIAAQLESATLALVNSQKLANPPNMVVNNTLNLGSGTYMIGSYVSGEMAISTDYGRTWTNSSPANLPQGIGGMASNGSRIIAVGAGSVISYSDDNGATWTDSGFTHVVGTGVFFNQVIWNQTSNKIVAVGTDAAVAVSDDNGLTWTGYQVSDANLDIKDLSLHDTGAGEGTWVLCGVDGAGVALNHAYYSTGDPLLNPWQAISDLAIDPVQTDGYEKVINDGYTWVMVGDLGNIVYSVSPSTPASWGITYELNGNNPCKGIGYMDGLFVAFGENNIAAVSMDSGANWDEYVVGNGDSSEIYTTMVADGTSGLILGAYDTARTFSKMRRV